MIEVAEQIELANELMSQSEDEGIRSVADLLDDMACVGLRLVRDTENVAGRAYHEVLR